MASSQRGQVLQLYKNNKWNMKVLGMHRDCFVLPHRPQLLYMGREYPKGYAYFRDRLKRAFNANAHVSNPEQISGLVARGEFVAKELEALYMLRKYRTLKQRYYGDEQGTQATAAKVTVPGVTENLEDFSARK